MARKLDYTDLDLLAELLHDYIDGVRDGEIVGSDWTTEELMDIHNTLIEMRDQT